MHSPDVARSRHPGRSAPFRRLRDVGAVLLAFTVILAATLFARSEPISGATGSAPAAVAALPARH